MTIAKGKALLLCWCFRSFILVICLLSELLVSLGERPAEKITTAWGTTNILGKRAMTPAAPRLGKTTSTHWQTIQKTKIDHTGATTEVRAMDSIVTTEENTTLSGGRRSSGTAQGQATSVMREAQIGGVTDGAPKSQCHREVTPRGWGSGQWMITPLSTPLSISPLTGA